MLFGQVSLVQVFPLLFLRTIFFFLESSESGATETHSSYGRVSGVLLYELRYRIKAPAEVFDAMPTNIPPQWSM